MPIRPLYDPNQESTNDEQLAAAQWELLRRNHAFQRVAERWTSSRAFRLRHSATPGYQHPKVHFPRCALDWMLTPLERIDLAKFQIRKHRWFVDSRFNFGPIEGRPLVHSLEMFKRKAKRSHEFKPLLQRFTLRLDDTWAETPTLFRTQFRLAYFGDAQFQSLEAKLRELGRALQIFTYNLWRGRKERNIDAILLGLSEAGAQLHTLAEFHRVFAVPNKTYTPSGLQKHLDAIRKVFEQAGEFDAKSRYNRHSSYLGTSQDWKWYLIAEAHELDWRQPSHLYQLAHLYSLDLKDQFAKRRKDAKAHGFRGVKTPSRVLRNRRKTVRDHCKSIQGWIDQSYPPPPVTVGVSK